jgi:hypothetical protein
VSAAGDVGLVVDGDSVEVVAALDRRRAEAFALELRSIARRYGLEVRSVRVRPGAGQPASTGDAAPGSGQ